MTSDEGATAGAFGRETSVEGATAGAFGREAAVEGATAGAFGRETAVEPIDAGRWRTRLSPSWSIGDHSNGGYVVSPVLRAMADLGGHTEPWSVTTHFLRPVAPPTGGIDAEVRAELVRRGRTTTVASGTLSVDGRERVTVLAALGDLDPPAGAPPHRLGPPMPDGPGPPECVDRAELAQGVTLPILERVDVRILPASAEAGASSRAVMEGWIRFADGTAPSALSLCLFADAFPPSLLALLGPVGWVPTIELTVHVRRRPAAGWIRARFECDDLADGRMVETGTLWDEHGNLVARSRQLGLLLTDPG